MTSTSLGPTCDCGAPLVMYWLHDSVWPFPQGQVQHKCVQCVEKKIGRKLTLHDLSMVTQKRSLAHTPGRTDARDSRRAARADQGSERPLSRVILVENRPLDSNGLYLGNGVRWELCGPGSSSRSRATRGESVRIGALYTEPWGTSHAASDRLRCKNHGGTSAGIARQRDSVSML